ncbi:MAG TPA: hypothetical protein DEF51_13215 [Myxococcales bacterium]|nr:hypothetical protein [Myxococcales bacterium]
MNDDDARALPVPRKAASALRYSLRALQLAWSTSRGLTVLLVLSTVVAGVAPAIAAYVARIVVDHTVAAMDGVAGARDTAMWAIGAGRSSWARSSRRAAG